MGFSPAGGNISGADDVALNNPATGDILLYDSIFNKWQNKQQQRTIINAQTSTSYTLNLNDAGALITFDNAGAVTLTVPQNVFAVGDHMIISQFGTGQVTVAGASGVTVHATPGPKLFDQWATAELIMTSSNTWLLVGRLTA